VKVNNQYKIKPLSMLESGKTAIIVTLNGHGNFRGRLAGMGIAAGRRITVVRNGRGLFRGGPVMISMGGHNLGICRGMAGKILVRELS
jgi:Fe2+ transport system protein FeoA